MLLLPVGLMAPAAAMGPALLLDAIATVGAYGVRRLRTAYAGPCLRARRSLDNAELDIGFAAGGLDTAALLAFCGSGDGFATTWYDQGGSGHHATQTAAANQPRVVTAGVLLTQAGHPCLDNSTDSRWLTLPTGTFATCASSTGLCVFQQAISAAGWWRIGSSGDVTHTPWGDGTAYENYLSTSRPSFGGYGAAMAPTVHTADNSGATLAVYKNGTQAGSAAAITFTANPVNLSGQGSNYGAVMLSEVILTSASLTTADRQIVERNMGSYYGIAVA